MIRTPHGQMRPLLFDGSPLLPTALFLRPDGKMLVGRDAERNAPIDPARFISSPKRHIDDGEVLIGGEAVPVARLFAHVLWRVHAEARRALGAASDEVRLIYPMRWGERRRAVLAEAAGLAEL